MSPTPRKALAANTLLNEVNKQAPGRSKASDGWIGDPAHAARTSDHNPDPRTGVVRALDITDDPKGGLDGSRLANLLAGMLGKHPALMSGAYVIHDAKIISYDRLDEGWRDYDGENPHRTHVHVSFSKAAAGYDSPKPFGLYVKRTPNPTPEIDRAIALTTAAINRRPRGGPARVELETALRHLKNAQRKAKA